MATVHWRNFINRLGIVKEPSGYFTGGYIIHAAKMELIYFQEMERRLLQAVQLNPRVISILTKFVDARVNSIERIRTRQDVLERNQIKNKIIEFRDLLRAGACTNLGFSPVSKGQISSVMLIVADFSVLFTTRDWDVCGTMSAVAGVVPHLSKD
jgi:hypothetical protein